MLYLINIKTNNFISIFNFKFDINTIVDNLSFDTNDDIYNIINLPFDNDKSLYKEHYVDDYVLFDDKLNDVITISNAYLKSAEYSVMGTTKNIYSVEIDCDYITKYDDINEFTFLFKFIRLQKIKKLMDV